MGRWSQRRLAGGGPSTQLQIISATILGTNESELTFNIAYDLGSFNAGDFTSNPSGEIGDGIFQDTPTTLRIGFLGDVSGDFDIDYAGTYPGLASPQNIPYT